MPRTVVEKPTSLSKLGFVIKPVATKGDQEAGWVYHVKGEAPEFWVRKTKKGRLVAYKTKDVKTAEATIMGLYNFTEDNGDLIGKRYSPTSSSGTPKLVQKTA